MKLNEFKAWFEGFTESMEGAPNKKQWERIKARVGEIDGIAVSYPVYIDRYVRPYYPYWSAFGVGSTSVGNSSGNTVLLSSQAQNSADYMSAANSPHDGVPAFDSTAAMYEAGKAEAAAQ